MLAAEFGHREFYPIEKVVSPETPGLGDPREINMSTIAYDAELYIDGYDELLPYIREFEGTYEPQPVTPALMASIEERIQVASAAEDYDGLADAIRDLFRAQYGSLRG